MKWFGCVWQRGHFLMERCDELLWPEDECDDRWQGTTSEAFARKLYYPHLCRDSAGLFAQEMGLW